jgi:hypothetical protein
MNKKPQMMEMTPRQEKLYRENIGLFRGYLDNILDEIDGNEPEIKEKKYLTKQKSKVY